MFRTAENEYHLGRVAKPPGGRRRVPSALRGPLALLRPDGHSRAPRRFGPRAYHEMCAAPGSDASSVNRRWSRRWRKTRYRRSMNRLAFLSILLSMAGFTTAPRAQEPIPPANDVTPARLWFQVALRAGSLSDGSRIRDVSDDDSDARPVVRQLR